MSGLLTLLAGDGDRYVGIGVLLLCIGVAILVVRYGRRLEFTLGKVHAELSPNGGGSVKDQLDQLVAGQATLRDDAARWQSEMLGRFNEMDSRVARLERAHRDRQEAS